MDGGSDFAARGGWWVAGQVVAFAAVVAALLWAPERGVSGLVAAIGWALVAAGVVLALDGIYQIRGHLTAYPAPLDHGQLTEHGSYRFVRHPIYGGLVIAAMGLAISSGNLVAALSGLVLGGFFYAKSGFEERLLIAKYSDYPAYQSRVRQRLIPWLL